MIELRRTIVSNLTERSDEFTKLHDLADGFQIYKEKNEDKKLRRLIRPIEQCLEGLRGVVVRDTAVDALCHGAQLAVPGIVAVARDLASNQLVGIYTMKGEVIGLAQSLMSIDDIQENDKGIAFQLKRIILKPNTYPRAWRLNNKDRLKKSLPK
jgi:H/ACA ribonucleoprotein complex subunit 4